MSDVIQGKDVVIEMLVDGVYYPILCGLDCSFTRSPEILEKTSTSSGTFKEFFIRREEWAARVNGLTKVDNDISLTFFYMLQTSVRRLEKTIRLTLTDPDGNDKQISGSALIGEETITGPMGDFSNASIEFRGTGSFTIEDVTPPVPPEFDIFSDYWATSNGNNYISGASSGSYTGTSYTLLSTDTILEVRVEGTSYEIISGTPGAGMRECHFNTSSLRIEFPADLIFDGNQRVFVMFKR